MKEKAFIFGEIFVWFAGEHFSTLLFIDYDISDSCSLDIQAILMLNDNTNEAVFDEVIFLSQYIHSLSKFGECFLKPQFPE